jgi:hypothetical protein
MLLLQNVIIYLPQCTIAHCLEVKFKLVQKYYKLVKKFTVTKANFK